MLENVTVVSDIAVGFDDVCGEPVIGVRAFSTRTDRWWFPLRRRCDSDFLAVAGDQHGWRVRLHRIFETDLLK